ncbi:FACT complex subunit SPT16-like [Papaver somniferum]|uniref:FACT complex subunit SPT16-like n=1 Tax=Papaver somniferum TaxID=3469 RepID=UPI000E70029A|nr:FACT complex subunit SPT16-like [Papaver somniferum]XP_026386931.1 FACT complex subunit SPT16-like [Papaver somniferum]XP_026386932.1 FACT complex subunit SPT16-like [Papaver somniferum]XP_026386933.1 FACT complex subunit SPT16-like [Papaver somniferum]XP_026386934.1 FACT complex subunit SPT16-like [Papaver somniferum]
MVIRLTDVTILAKVGCQETIAGILEAHATGFVFIASDFSICFSFDSVKKSFFRLGDKRMPPLLHFHLYDPIMVGTEMTKDIHFHLVHCPLGQDRCDHDSDKIEKGNLISDEGLNKDLKNFVDKVRERWNFQMNPPCLFEELEKEYEFYGVLPSKASAGFALTSFSLIVLEESRFIVVPLRDIDIVNLALVRLGEIDMTVICQDFEVDHVHEISSIPLTSLARIKRRLNNGWVKYYVNAEKSDWKSVVKGIVDFPAKFMENGGWDHYNLEDAHTFAYYKETGVDPLRAALEEG